ncbi:hypothetical protein AAFF_G00134470 [Aldrovandia affinis]|uniref:Uncharacterized protein n=1 Tax=Aldrovandia affinis TaxID=143900 RepID=A0AAD7R1A4_9TELE|nr:hypothetical protein AAFF_G00134470 [Aldrovandia affinis]
MGMRMGCPKRPQDVLSDDEDTLEMDDKIALLKNRVWPIQEDVHSVFKQEALVAVCQKHQVMVLREVTSFDDVQSVSLETEEEDEAVLRQTRSSGPSVEMDMEDSV